MRAGVIRVLTTKDSFVLHEHSRLMKNRYGIDSISKCIPNQPKGIYDERTLQEAIPKIIELAKEMEHKDQVSIITISCASDPALEECRKAVSIPVIGAGQTGALNSLIFCKNVGVIGITEQVPESILSNLGTYYLDYSVPAGVTNTTDLFKPEIKSEFMATADALIKQGADGILFACTGFSTIGLKEQVKDKLHIPIIDLVDAQAAAIRSYIG